MKVKKSFLCFFMIGMIFSACKSNDPGNVKIIQMHERYSYPVSSTLEERRAGIDKMGTELFSPQESKQIQADNKPKAELIIDKKEENWVYGRQLLQNGLLSEALRVATMLYKNLEDAQPLASKLSLEQDAKNAYLFIADTMLQFKNYKNEGRHILEKLVELEPKWEDGYVSLAKQYISESAFSLAERVLLRVLDRVEAPSESTYLLLAQAQKSQKQISRSMQTMARAQSLYPLSSLPVFWRAVIDFENGEQFKSCQEFYKILEPLKEMAAAHYNAGLCYIREGNLESAEKIINAATLHFADEPGFRLLAGVVAQKKGDQTKARRVWNEYLLMTDDSALTAKVNDALKRLH